MKSHPDAVKYFTKLNSDLPSLSGILQGYFDIINMAVQEYNEIIVKSGLISNRTTTVGNITGNVKIDKNKKINSNTPPKQEKADNAGDDPLSKAKAEYKKAVEDFVNKNGKKPTRKKAQQMSSEIIKKYGLERGTVIWESVEEFIDDEDEVVRDSSTSWYY
jgi:TPP-dependent 2-oxoacid decarboxylase